MSAEFDNKLELLSSNAAQALMGDLARGIEKEGLRVTRDGKLAKTPHPPALGAPLTHPFITTDFSENLLEFITPVYTSVDAALQQLETIHRFTSNVLNDELVWAASMPCELPADDAIPLAEYGSSNIATMKTAYRRGLGHRYGRAMQMVAGIHYNFSLPAGFWPLLQEKLGDSSNASVFQTRQYLHLIRNFRRYYWLLIYLFGSAPAVDQSFVQGREHRLQQLSDDTFYSPQATSLRMGDLGYQSQAQQALFVCYNEIDNYIATLGDAITTPYPAYEAFGLERDGAFQQLSTALLQIENEFYSPIRPKRVTRSGEKPLAALAARGIEYVEVRCLDIDPFAANGISSETIHFLDAFLMYCLLDESPLCDRSEFLLIAENQSQVVNHGLDEKLDIFCGNDAVKLRDCGNELLDRIEMIAEQLDAANGGKLFANAIQAQRQKLANTDATPAMQIRAAMAEHGHSHLQFALAQSQAFAEAMSNIDDEKLATMEKAARDSDAERLAIEAADTVDFSEYLDAYFSDTGR